MGFASQLIPGIFVFGLIIGSFLNAVIYRLHAGRSITEKHSICPRCKHALGFRDLIPVASFFILGGRCRYCNKPISWQYPAVELVTALAFTLVYSQNGLSLTTYHLLLTTCFLIIIFVYDFKHYLILDKVLVPGVVLAVIFQVWRHNFWNGLSGALALSGFFGLLYVISRGRWIGFGDVKLGVFLGFLIPWPATTVLFFLAYIVGAVVAVILLAFGAKGLGDRLPFGTFLTLAAFIAMLWGDEMVGWYLRLLGIT